MKNYFKGLLLAFLTLSLFAVPVWAAFTAIITITEASGNSYSMLGGNVSANISFMETNNFLGLPEGRDTRVSLGTSAQHHMLVDDKIMFTSPVGAYSATNLNFTTNNSDIGTFSVITGYGGYITTPDAAAIEPSANFTLLCDGWWDTGNQTGLSGSAFYKPEAIYFGVSDNASDNITGIMADDVTDYNGNAYYQTGDTTTFKWLHGAEDTSNFKMTWEWWMRVDDNTPSVKECIFSTGDGTSSNAEFNLYMNTNGTLQLMINRAAGGTNVINSSSNTSTPDLGWHHYGLTYDQTPADTNARFYLDGVAAGTRDKTGNAPSTANSQRALHIGSFGTPGNYLNGQIDEVRLTKNVVRTQAQIQEAYANGLGRRLVDLNSTDALWHFDEYTGLNSADDSGNGHTLAGTNTGWVSVGVPILNSQLSVNATSTVSGDYKAELVCDGTTLFLELDDVVQDSIVMTNCTVPNLSADWTIAQGTAIAYADNITISVGNVVRLQYSPAVIITPIDSLTATMPDEVGSNDGVITWGSTPAGVSAVAGAMVSDYTGTTLPGGVGETPSFVPSYTTPAPVVPATKLTALAGHPFYPWVDAMDGITNVGILFQFQFIYIAGAIFAFAGTYTWLRNLMLSGALALGVIGLGVPTIFDWWVLLPCVALYLGLIMMEGRRTI